MKRRIPYGISSFQKMIEDNFYYVDKTRYIEELELFQTPVFLRPRRFGKSLLTEMLRWYYDIKASDHFDALFGHLYIGKNPTPLKNSFFFLGLNFSGMSAFAHGEPDFAFKNFNHKILTDINSFLRYYSKELGWDEKMIGEFRKEHADNAGVAISDLTDIVKKAGGKLYLSIDEYDSLTNALALNFIHAPDEKNEYLNITRKGGFFRTFFEDVKYCTQKGLEKVYITGILPITISDMNSGFNIAQWVTHEERFVNMLGITKNELGILLDEIYADNPRLSLSREETEMYLKTYYNGYKFRKYSELVYNPTMTMYFLDHLIRNNSVPEFLADQNIRVQYNQVAYIFGNNSEERDRVIKTITEKQKLNFSVTPGRLFDMKDYKSGKFISECLYYQGLLTYGNGDFEFVIPNLVTYEMVLSYFERISNFELDGHEFDQHVIAYFYDGDIVRLIKAFFEEIIQKFPGDFFKDVNESFYRGLLFHVLYMILRKNVYEILPEYNLPNGTVDLMVRTLKNSAAEAPVAELIEIKRVPKSASDAEFNVKFEEAQAQVLKYKTGEYKDFRAVAVCFRGNKDYRITVQ